VFGRSRSAAAFRSEIEDRDLDADVGQSGGEEPVRVEGAAAVQTLTISSMLRDRSP
jgi:hypothetical protein